MKGLFSPETDEIVSYGLAYEEMRESENVYEIPEDFEFGKYNYTSIIQGVFNPEGFVLIENNNLENEN
jgi:hypothetical protein